MSQNKNIVNSWNEWDPLEEIIVGTADGAHFEATEPGNHPKIRHPDLHDMVPFPSGAKKADTIAKANEELDGLANLLSSQGIIVKRPEINKPFSGPITSPDFTIENQYCAVCPRDVLITFGNEVLEATMSRRSRFFEYLPYRALVYHYWESDPDMLWNAAPKPSMADDMYLEEFWNLSQQKRFNSMHQFQFCVTQNEVIFDAADMNRFGRDIIVQESMTTNRAGIRWLKKHLEPRGFRVHPVHFPLDLFPSHIDCTFVPLRPGLILTNPDRPIAKGEEKLFFDNDWEFIDVPEPSTDNQDMPIFCQSSKWLSMNVLSMSPTQVICEAQEKRLQDMLDKQGFEVYPIPFRHVFEFGGSLHCATWDVRRQGVCENYFSKVDYTPLSVVKPIMANL